MHRLKKTRTAHRLRGAVGAPEFRERRRGPASNVAGTTQVVANPISKTLHVPVNMSPSWNAVYSHNAGGSPMSRRIAALVTLVVVGFALAAAACSSNATTGPSPIRAD